MFKKIFTITLVIIMALGNTLTVCAADIYGLNEYNNNLSDRQYYAKYNSVNKNVDARTVNDTDTQKTCTTLLQVKSLNSYGAIAQSDWGKNTVYGSNIGAGVIVKVPYSSSGFSFYSADVKHTIGKDTYTGRLGVR